MKRSQESPGLFKVGDRVKVPHGFRIVTRVVTEDRGPLGVGGRRLYYVEIPSDPFDPIPLLLPEEDLEPAPDTPPPKLEKSKVLEFLTMGGLLSMLRQITPGGKYQPRVWLCLDTIGNLTYTLVEERGLLGGAVVPYWTIERRKIRSEKKNRCWLSSRVSVFHRRKPKV